MIDSGGISSLLKLIEQCEKSNTKIHLSNMNRSVARPLIKAKLNKRQDSLALFPTIEEAQTAFLPP